MSPELSLSGMSTTAITGIFPSAEKLDGSNYQVWKVKMKMLLQERGLWDIVMGEECPPKGAGEDALKYQKKEQSAFNSICLNVKDKLLIQCSRAKTARNAWKALEDTYQSCSAAKKMYLRRKFFTTKMVPGEDMKTLINKITLLVDEMESVGVQTTDEDVIVTLLNSLPDEFQGLVAALESRTEDLTLNYVFGRLLDEELRKSGSIKKIEENALISNDKHPRRPSRPFKGRNNYFCEYCKKKGHTSSNCYKKQDNEAKKHEFGNAATAEDRLFISALSMTTNRDSQTWYIDSGASQHFTHQKELFTEYEEIPTKKVFMGDDRTLDAIGQGTIQVNLNSTSQQHTLTFKEVLYVPEIAKNLLSVSKATSEGLSFSFDHSGCQITDQNGSYIASGIRDQNLYKLTYIPSYLEANISNLNHETPMLWHRRFGHINFDYLSKMIKNKLISGVKIDPPTTLEPCEACIIGKQARQPFKSSGIIKTMKKLDLIHSDLCGPMQNLSLGGKKYLITFIDDYTRYTWVYFMERKEEALSKFREFKAMVETETGEKSRKSVQTMDGNIPQNSSTTSAKFMG